MSGQQKEKDLSHIMSLLQLNSPHLKVKLFILRFGLFSGEPFYVTPT